MKRRSSAFFTNVSHYPRFKSKKNPVQSYTSKRVNGNIKISGNKLKLPKMDWMRFAKSREVDGNIRRATIRRKPSGKYYVSILCETDLPPFPKTGEAVGIDLGITDFAILSTGEKKDNHRFTSKMEKKLKKAQRKGK